MNPWARRATCQMRRSFLLASLIISLLLNSGWTDLILARARASLATSDSGVSDSPRPWWRRLRSRLQSPLCPRKLMHGDVLELWRHQEPQPPPLATLRVELLLDPWRAKWTFIPWTKDGEGSLATFHTKVPLQQACNLAPAAARTSPPQPWWKLIFPRTPRRVIHLRSPEHTNATWILTPWTKDHWTKVRALKDSVLGSDTDAQSRPDQPPSKPHMCVLCLCHGHLLCWFALHWCDPPPCITSAGSSLLTPTVWPQVCLQPRQLHARPAAFPPAGAQGLLHCPLLLWFKPQVHLAGMHPALRSLSSPVLIPVRFRARESHPVVQCLACASRSVNLKWVIGGRPVAQGLLGSHKSLSQGDCFCTSVLRHGASTSDHLYGAPERGFLFPCAELGSWQETPQVCQGGRG